jgi:Leucine-rich repeat (LRR) protein
LDEVKLDLLQLQEVTDELSNNAKNFNWPLLCGGQGQISTLTVLDLQSNDLTGRLPTEFGTMSSLEQLYLNDNNLLGSIPRELGQISMLQYLHLHNNALTGTLPTELETLSSLISLTK